MQGSSKTNEAKKEVGRWAPDQHQRFLAAIATYGKDWKKVEEIVGTRSGSQVRSHAQKFFNKLLKDQHQKKTGDPKSKKSQKSLQHNDEQSEHSFMKYLHEEGSVVTPIQLVSLIRGESQNDNEKKVDIKNFQKKLQQKMSVIKQEQNEDQLQNIKRQTSFKSFNNILEAYQTVKEPNKNKQLQNQSFLIGLTRHYKNYFVKGGKFQNLIDFGNPAEVQQAEIAVRKRSFTLPQGIQGDESDLQNRKKRVITCQQTFKMTKQQQQKFEQQLKKNLQLQKVQNEGTKNEGKQQNK